MRERERVSGVSFPIRVSRAYGPGSFIYILLRFIILDFLVCPFQPFSSFYFLCHISFLERSFVDLVSKPNAYIYVCVASRRQRIKMEIYLTYRCAFFSNYFSCEFVRFFVVFSSLNAWTELHVYSDIMTIPGRSFFLFSFSSVYAVVALLATFNSFHSVLFF